MPSQYHCNICHNYDGGEEGMIEHFFKVHPREWESTNKRLLEESENGDEVAE